MELISRADAIKDVESWVAVDEHERHLQKNVIEWLKEFPPAELSTNLAEVGTDAISRDDVLRIVDYYGQWNDYHGREREAIEQLPPIQPKRGKWIYCEDSTADCVDGYRCDQCGFFVPWDYQHKSIDYIKDYNFCPHCGADMRQREE